MYETILVPVDLSHAEVGSKALKIARRMGGPEARIVALYVAADVPKFIANQIPEGVREEHIATARSELTSRAEEVGAECEIRAGHAATIILEYAEQIGADLVIIASHRPGVQDYLLGSTAARVVRHADCTVLVER